MEHFPEVLPFIFKSTPQSSKEHFSSFSAYLPRGIVKILHRIRKFFPFHSRNKDIEKYSFKIFNALNFLQQLDEIMRRIGKIALSI
jgi:hypothetical protein